MEHEYKSLAEKLLFDFGKAVLGQNTGGMIVKLRDTKGIEGAREVIRLAATKQDAREYVGAVLRGQKETNVTQIGETVGGYTWTGSVWKENM